jgi:hypothetical protein
MNEMFLFLRIEIVCGEVNENKSCKIHDFSEFIFESEMLKAISNGFRISSTAILEEKKGPTGRSNGAER